MKRRTRPADAPRVVRARILTAFSRRARDSGIRAVLMGELAAELRMSAVTLYKHFASKDDLVDAMVDAWAVELAAIDALEWDKVQSCSSLLEVLLAWADAWTASMSHVSTAFFEDLRRDHPEAWQRFTAQIQESKEAAVKYLEPFLRDDVHPGAALLILDRIVMHAVSPHFADRLDISRNEAVRAALSIWGGGALRKRTKLRSLEPTPRSRRSSPREKDAP